MELFFEALLGVLPGEVGPAFLVASPVGCAEVGQLVRSAGGAGDDVIGDKAELVDFAVGQFEPLALVQGVPAEGARGALFGAADHFSSDL